MLTVVFNWLFLFWVCLSFGLMGNHLFTMVSNETQKENQQSFATDQIVLLGFLIISVISSILSIFTPISEIIETVFVVLALVGCALLWKSIRTRALKLTSSVKKMHWSIWLMFFFIVVIVLFLAVGRIYNYDTGLYHSQAIMWIQEYSVVPGLGNLHGRFAFNSHFFISSALFTVEDPGKFLIYPLNSFLYIIFLQRLFFNIDRGIKNGDWFKGLLAIFMVFLSLCYFIPQLTSPSPDMACAILICYAFLYLLEQGSLKLGIEKASFLCLLIFVSITFKLSTVLLALIIPFTWESIKDRKILIGVVIGLLVFLPFLIRNYYLSGYLVYPFEAIDIFNPEWKIPAESVIGEKTSVQHWARIPGGKAKETMAMSLSEWVPKWWSWQPSLMKQLLILNLGSVLALLIALFRRQFKFCLLIILGILNLAFWFFSAPDPRFAYGFVFSVGAMSTAYVLSSLLGFVQLKNLKLLMRIVLSSALIFCLVRPLYITGAKVLLEKPPMHSLNKPRIYPPPNIKQAKMSFEAYTPKKGDQCFNGRLPCTPYPKKNLVKRNPKRRTFQDGFKLK